MEFFCIQDLKVLKSKIGDKLLKSPKVYFDLENKLMQDSIASIYPQLVLLNNDNEVVLLKCSTLPILRQNSKALNKISIVNTIDILYIPMADSLLGLLFCLNTLYPMNINI